MEKGWDLQSLHKKPQREEKIHSMDILSLQLIDRFLSPFLLLLLLFLIIHFIIIVIIIIIFGVKEITKK